MGNGHRNGSLHTRSKTKNTALAPLTQTSTKQLFERTSHVIPLGAAKKKKNKMLFTTTSTATLEPSDAAMVIKEGHFNPRQ